MDRMFGVWIFSIILSLGSFALAENSEKKWRVSSESKTFSRKISKLVKDNKRLNKNDLKNLILKRLKSDRYLTAKLVFDEDNNRIIFTEINKYLIIIEGNEAIFTQEIKSRIDLDNLISSEATIIDDLKLRIKNLYNDNGYNDVDINIDEVKFPGRSLVRLVIKIDEGPIYSFKKIYLNGSFSKKKKFYINYLRSKSSSLIKSGKFSKLDLENGLDNLITHLKNLGYLEATYSGLRVERAKGSKNRVIVFFDLYEGQPTRVRDIRFIGNKDVDAEWLSVLLGFKDGERMNFYELEKGVNRIYDYYLSTGYLEVKINPEQKDFVVLNSEKRSSEITVEIDESDKVIVGDIKIDGLENTKAYVVKNIVDFEVGDVLTISKIKASKRKLNLSGIFSKVDIQFDDKMADGIARSVTVQIEEKKPGVVQLGLGARFNQQALSLRGYAGVLYKNLGGTARALNTRLELQSRLNRQAYPEHRAFISYYEPFVIDKNVRGRISVDSSENIFEIRESTVTLFRSLGFNFIIEDNFNQHIKASWILLGINFNKEFEINDLNPEIREQIGFFGPTFQLDYRNNPFVPTKGYFFRSQAEYGSPKLSSKIIAKDLSTDVEYLRAESTYTRYSPLSTSLILVNTLRGGWIQNLSSGTDRFPKSRAFFLGGSSTIRGFDPSDGVNERIPSDRDLGVDTSARGGDVLSIPKNSYFYLLKTEFRFPIFNEFWASLFYDGGSVIIDQISQKDPYRDAAGIGIRYNTPIGALTVDFGFKLDQDKSRGESLERIHINIGTF